MHHGEDHELEWRLFPPHGDHSRSDSIPGHLDDLHDSPEPRSIPSAIYQDESAQDHGSLRHKPCHREVGYRVQDPPRPHVIRPATTRITGEPPPATGRKSVTAPL